MKANEIDKLNKLAIQSLQSMFNKDQMLFTNKSYKSDNGLVHLQKTNTRYTAMNLIGLYYAAQNGYASDLPVTDILNKYIELTPSLEEDELGLILWVNALYNVLSYNDIEKLIKANRSYFYGKYVKSMSLAWYLQGLALTYLLNKTQLIKEEAHKIKQELFLLYNPATALFRDGKLAIKRTPVKVWKEYKGKKG